MPGATLPNPRRPVRLETPLAPGAFFAFERGLWPRSPGQPRKNPLVCVLNPASTVPEQGAFANSQVDGLQGFGLLPPAELKRKHTLFFAREHHGARPTEPQPDLPPQAYSASPASASTSVTSVMVKSGTARRGSSLASWSSLVNGTNGAIGQLRSGSSPRRSYRAS